MWYIRKDDLIFTFYIVCKLALHSKYSKYATDGFTALYTRPPVVYISAAAPPEFSKQLQNQVRWLHKLLIAAVLKPFYTTGHKNSLQILFTWYYFISFSLGCRNQAFALVSRKNVVRNFTFCIESELLCSSYTRYIINTLEGDLFVAYNLIF